MRSLVLALALVGCTKADQTADRPEPPQTPEPGVAFSKPPTTTTTTPPAVVQAAATIELTAVTLADDCGGTPPYSAPPAPVKTATAAGQSSEPKAKAKADSAREDEDISARGARAKRRCEQTSMQLAITAPNAGSIKVKSVELFDEGGKSLGVLAASKPTRWSDTNGMYEAWDEGVPASTLINVSYVLQQPDWSNIGDRWNRTYTLKTTITIGGVDQSAQKDVTLRAATTLPPNVKT
jgi:hypothetical protein